MISKIKTWFVGIMATKYLGKGIKALVVALSGVLLGLNIPPEIVDKFGEALEPILTILGTLLITYLGQ